MVGFPITPASFMVCFISSLPSISCGFARS
jgi:hypothetical protein